ncbi:MAG: methionine--tRNA ligase subunit beta [Candidatus Ryanbacteria bacterium CG10_big_fil_rev_8_21_14_0_10_43_42]|uniref:Methionine--tRNA ligase n=1 Tax=Candidatus Ryanbacteria bacterium CG10_big_fil_rev_8_21_14_0_10_43_42 TaxID=1974864 RepID=A0A2M8KWK8_9BACT|nr:MAG: methionine--tRNA ligase subunit beta [Candidatus Ryanbacteria bacterium CG10_big_fil_rev_8_21_14_0_10_43_42]
MEDKKQNNNETEPVLHIKISYDDFAKVELRTARILSAEAVEGSDKLVRLRVSLGTKERQLLAGIGKSYTPDDLVGKIIAVVANLKPRKMMGMESDGMLLAASGEDGPVLLTSDKEISPGAEIR